MSLARVASICGGLFTVLALVFTCQAVSVGAETNDERGASRADLYEAIEALGPRAKSLWPDEYGWIRIEPGHPEKGVDVGFTTDAAEKVKELAGDFPEPELLRAVTVPYSGKALRERVYKMVGDQVKARSGRGPLAELRSKEFDLDSDVWTGTVEVTMETVTREDKEVFKSTYGDDVRLLEGGLGHPASCTNRRRCGKVLRAGISARNNPNFNTYKCSTGFTVTSGGVRHVLSAAHCSNLPFPSTGGALPSQQRYHGEVLPTQFGSVKKHFLYGGVDAELLSVEAPFEAMPWIYREDDDQQFPVSSMGTWAEVYEGQTLCRAGQSSGRRCGSVLGTGYHPNRGGVDFIRFSACSESGDSGGPVFAGSKAWGIFDGWIYGPGNPNCDTNPGPVQSYAGAINWALNNLDASLVYAP